MSDASSVEPRRPFELSADRRALLDALLEAEGLADTRAHAIPRRDRDGALPLSFGQQRLWVLHQLDPGGGAYNLFAAVRLRGPLDVEALSWSLDELVRRHEALRTGFTLIDGEPVQVIAPAEPLPLAVVDLDALPEDERESELRRRIDAEAELPFDLERDRLLRAALLRLGPEEHVFLVTVHHIIADGWSVSVLGRELGRLYAAFLAGEPSPLPELPIQYADYAMWQRDEPRRTELEAELAYWRRQLAGDLPALQLPTDFARPPVQTYRGGREALDLSPELSAALRALSQQEEVTLFMSLLAAFGLLLQRLSGQEEVILGSPIAGRNREELEGLIGFFVNSLVLRLDLAGSPSFRELIHRVQDVAVGAFAHQNVPFEMLLEALRPERDLSRTPFFQVFFNMLRFADMPFELPGVTAEVLVRPEPGSKFDLTLYVGESEDRIHFSLVYNADLFTSARMAELLAQLKQLLVQAVANPDKAIAQYSIITDRAKERLPNPTQPLDAHCDETVVDVFVRQAGQAPGRVALVDRHGAWSYGELDARSNELAGALRAAGVQASDAVAVYGQRSAALVWALLGVLKAGAAFAILDPAYPPARLIACLRSAQPRGWIQLAEAGPPPDELATFAASLPGAPVALPSGPEQARSWADQAPSAPEPDIHAGPHDLAYVAFTSGSTGQPKAILGEHGPLAHFVAWQHQTFGLSGSDRFALLSGLGHDPLLRDIFSPLCAGATLCIPDEETVASPVGLLGWLQSEAVSVLHLTPEMGQLLAGAADDLAMPAMRHAFFGGDVLSRSLVRRFRELAPNAVVTNVYGATETPQAMGYAIIADPEDAAAANGRPLKEALPLGVGIADAQLLVLTAAGLPAGVGEVGEIHVRSPFLTRGYAGDEHLTAERFVVSPFTGAPGDRLYRTGDLGRYLLDGTVEFLGRNDRQVKLWGFRVELEEVEAVLGEHPAIRQSVALLWQPEHASDQDAAELGAAAADAARLVAYVVPQDSAVPAFDVLRAFLLERLPGYMVPAAIVPVEALPLTPNGKLDLRALPPPNLAQAAAEVAFVAPRTPMEQLIAELWLNVLAVDQVGVYDNFFDLGGVSLLAMHVASRLEHRTGVRIDPRALVNQTLGQLAASCQQRVASP
jgi:amino acid adenylation domain-containing protein